MSSARFPTGQRGLPLPVVQGEEEFMEKLIEALQEIPEAAELLHCAENGGCPAAMTVTYYEQKYNLCKNALSDPCLRGIAGAGKAASSGGVQ